MAEEKIDWRTPTEVARDEENARLVERFKVLMETAPSISRAMRKLAAENNLNPEALRQRFIRIGIYVPGKTHGNGSELKINL